MLETGEPGQYLLQQSRGLAESIEFRYLDTRECSVFILCTISLVDIVEMRVSAHLSVEKIRNISRDIVPQSSHSHGPDISLSYRQCCLSRGYNAVTSSDFLHSLQLYGLQEQQPRQRLAVTPRYFEHAQAMQQSHQLADCFECFLLKGSLSEINLEGLARGSQLWI